MPGFIFRGPGMNEKCPVSPIFIETFHHGVGSTAMPVPEGELTGTWSILDREESGPLGLVGTENVPIF